MNPFRPRRLKIVEPGWAGYTGIFGMTEFADGVSVHPVSMIEQQRLGAIIRIESLEEAEAGLQVSPSAELIRIKTVDANSARAAAADTGVMIDNQIMLAGANYTRQELEEIADKQGINGLRTIGTTMHVKGRSISELINGILERQGTLEPVTAE